MRSRGRLKPRAVVACDLIEAGLNEPLTRPSSGRDSRPRIFDHRQIQTHHNFGDMARMLLIGEVGCQPCVLSMGCVAEKVILTTVT